jgi:transposase
MFCNSDSWDSASCRSEPRSRPLAMEAVYFLYSTFSLFIRVHGETVWKSEWGGRSMTYAPEHEEEILHRSLRRRMGGVWSSMFRHPTSEDDRKLTPPARSWAPSSTSSRAAVPGGCCPETFRPGRGVYLWFGRWRIDGTWERLNRAIRERLRTRLGRNPHPSAGAVRARWSRSRSKPRVREEKHEATTAQRRSKVASAACCSWSVSHRPTLLAVTNSCGKGFSEVGLSPVLGISGVWGSIALCNDIGPMLFPQLGGDMSGVPKPTALCLKADIAGVVQFH